MAEQYLGNRQITAKDIYARDLTAVYSKNILQYPTSKLEDSEKQMAPVNPLWWMYTLVQSNMGLTLPDWVQAFLIFDDKFFLRNGAVHTEVGRVYPVAMTDKDIPKPGDDLVTKRGDYLRIIQEESGKDPIYLRTLLDKRFADHADKFYSFNDYSQIMSYYVTALTRANNLFLNSLVAGMFIGMTGGAVMFDAGTDLEKFFQPTGKDITPTEAFSKAARAYYSNDGEVKKHIKREVGRMVGLMKNRAVYDPSLIVDEINPTKKEIKESKFPDISDQAKLKTWIKGMYTSDNNKTHEETRRKSLWGLLEAIEYKVGRMTTTNSVYN